MRVVGAARGVGNAGVCASDQSEVIAASKAGGAAHLSRSVGGLLAAALVSASVVHDSSPALAAPPEVRNYDGFAEYAAKGNRMEETDVDCLIGESQCRAQTFACFSGQEKLGGTGDLSCLKGVVCLGRCKGEQRCATQCFAQYGSSTLDSWLSCAIEEQECVKVPKDLDYSQINLNPPSITKEFRAEQLAAGPAIEPQRQSGSWYKVLGLNPKYDLYDCQVNTFTPSGADQMQIDIEFRVPRPNAPATAAWPNGFAEQLTIDAPDNKLGRSFHTEGKMFGLTFNENWYILGGRDAGSDGAEPFWVAQYKGHTLQGNYEGAFIFAKHPQFPESARPALAAVLQKAGMQLSDFQPIDNACPELGSYRGAGSKASFREVLDLVEWVRPGTIFKYDN